MKHLNFYLSINNFIKNGLEMRKLSTTKVYILSISNYGKINLIFLFQKDFLTMLPGISINHGKNIKSSLLVE